MPDVSRAQPLGDDWRAVLDGVARAHRWPTTEEPARLVPRLVKLSAAYNDLGGARVEDLGADVLPARLLFGFPRDVPKTAAAVTELVSTGALVLSEKRPLKVLDLGAGMGATTFGLLRALGTTGSIGRLEATWVDADAAALATGAAIAKARSREGAVSLGVHTMVAPVGDGPPPRGDFDVILLGQVLSELHRDKSEEERVAHHAAYVRELLRSSLRKDGSLVIVEPALRDRTRHLHRVREALLAEGGVVVFAPCLHEAACPMLAREHDWCHEDLPVDLPPWLVPIARGAGLRFEGLTFSYLVLRKEGPTLRERLPGSLRIVSQLRRTKGKAEITVCGPLADGPGGTRLMRLDREAKGVDDDFESLTRGDIVNVTPLPPSNAMRAPRETRFHLASIELANPEAIVDGHGSRPLGDDP